MIVKFPAIAIIRTHYRLLWRTTVSDVKARYAGSLLGLGWLLLFPLLLLGCYAIIYVFVFQVKTPQLTTYEYVAMIFCGLVPFLTFADALGNGVSSVTANSNLIRNTLFPIDLIPVKAVLASQSIQAAGLLLLLPLLFSLGKLGVWSSLIIVVWLSQLLFTIGLIWILSSLNVYFS